MKISPMAYKIFQSSFIILPSPKYALKYYQRQKKILPKWCNFAKFGHTACGSRIKRKYFVSLDMYLFTIMAQLVW